MGCVDPMALASALPDPISISPQGLSLVLLGILAICALGIGIAATALGGPCVAIRERDEVRPLVARSPDQPAHLVQHARSAMRVAVSRRK